MLSPYYHTLFNIEKATSMHAVLGYTAGNTKFHPSADAVLLLVRDHNFHYSYPIIIIREWYPSLILHFMCGISILGRECRPYFNGRLIIFCISLFLGFLTALVLAPVSVCSHRLVGGSQLTIGEFLCSPNGRYRFGLLAEQNGDLAVWENDEGSTKEDEEEPRRNILWSIPLYAEGANVTLTMQLDGDAVVSDSSGGGVLFLSKSHGHPGAFLELQEDGSVRVILMSSDDCGIMHLMQFELDVQSHM
jgi:hypothetical protein